MSDLGTSGTRVAAFSTVQWTLVFNKRFFTKSDAYRASTQVNTFVQVYPASPEQSDKSILQGELVWRFAAPYVYLGEDANGLLQRSPICSSLNGLMLPKSLFNGKSATWSEIKRVLHRAIKVVGVARKPHSYMPSPDKPKDAPIAWTMGPAPMMNSGPYDICAGDWIMADFPEPGPNGAPNRLTDHDGLSATKRMLIPVPYKNRGKQNVVTLREAYKATAAELNNPAVQVELDESLDYLPIALLNFAKFIAFAVLRTQHFGDEMDTEAIQKSGILEEKGTQLHSVKLYDHSNVNAIDVSMERYLMAMMAGKPVFKNDKVNVKAKEATELLLGALSAQVSEDLSRVFARARKNAPPGVTMDVELGGVATL